MRLSVAGLDHTFPGAARMFFGLDAEFRSGELIAVTGPSGAGKSTLLKVLAGWLEPSSGRVIREGIGVAQWVLQQPVGVAGRTALDHVCLPLIARGDSRDEAELHARSLLERFGLGKHDRHPFWQLSGGQAQRLMLARAAAAAPELLLIDEPTAQLDRRTAQSVAEIIGELADDSRIVIVATHDTMLAEACTRILALDLR